jgi:predicted nucleotide-binding protein (sugar kinase/HSP70/actin superfamily)
MTHSVKFGADKFNRDIDTWLLGNNEGLQQTIAEKICEASNIDIDTAKGGRMHNYLWCGLDFFVIDNYPKFIPEMNSAYKNVDIDEISAILSEVFHKPIDLIKDNVKKHIDLVINHEIKDKQSFLRFWKDFISDLPDKDDVNLEKAYETIIFIENQFNKHWEEIINRVVSDIEDRMKFYLEK